jgi:hypothetical protein
MNDAAFMFALVSLYRRGFADAGGGITADEARALLDHDGSEPGPSQAPSPAEERAPEAHEFAPCLAASDEDQARHVLDLGNRALIGRIDTKKGIISVETDRIPAGTLLYVGFPAEGAARVCGPTTLATPFNRAFQAALRILDNLERAQALIGLACRLSPSLVRESILHEARRCAERIEEAAVCNNLLTTILDIEEGRQPTVHVALPEEPDCTGAHWGRFVMLRHGLREGRALAFLPSFPLDGTRRAGFVKVVHFAAEVEVAPGLFQRSREEAQEYDEEGLEFWQHWRAANQ